MLTGLGTKPFNSNEIGFDGKRIKASKTAKVIIRELKQAVDICAYTGKKLPKNDKTFEHILPYSFWGTNKKASWNLSNGLVAGGEINKERGNMDLGKWFKIHPDIAKNVQNYLNKFRGLTIKGHDYVKEVKTTLNKESHGVVTFTGNKITGNKLNTTA